MMYWDIMRPKKCIAQKSTKTKVWKKCFDIKPPCVNKQNTREVSNWDSWETWGFSESYQTFPIPVPQPGQHLIKRV
jgi:hypothetical protein